MWKICKPIIIYITPRLSVCGHLEKFEFSSRNLDGLGAPTILSLYITIEYKMHTSTTQGTPSTLILAPHTHTHHHHHHHTLTSPATSQEIVPVALHMVSRLKSTFSYTTTWDRFTETDIRTNLHELIYIGTVSRYPPTTLNFLGFPRVPPMA